jgi:lysosomal-associated membrane protein 1/2
VVLHVADIRLQAFMKSHENVFGEEENCVASSSSQIVPIAVGCALLALVLIVVAAYLISRRRSRQGYQSV